jgi:hypothetical protein
LIYFLSLPAEVISINTVIGSLGGSLNRPRPFGVNIRSFYAGGVDSVIVIIGCLLISSTGDHSESQESQDQKIKGFSVG